MQASGPHRDTHRAPPVALPRMRGLPVALETVRARHASPLSVFFPPRRFFSSPRGRSMAKRWMVSFSLFFFCSLLFHLPPSLPPSLSASELKDPSPAGVMASAEETLGTREKREEKKDVSRHKQKTKGYGFCAAAAASAAKPPRANVMLPFGSFFFPRCLPSPPSLFFLMLALQGLQASFGGENGAAKTSLSVEGVPRQVLIELMKQRHRATGQIRLGRKDKKN